MLCPMQPRVPPKGLGGEGEGEGLGKGDCKNWSAAMGLSVAFTCLEGEGACKNWPAYMGAVRRSNMPGRVAGEEVGRGGAGGWWEGRWGKRKEVVLTYFAMPN